MQIQIRRLTAAEGGDHLQELAAVLRDCVESGASVGFMTPFSQAEAERFFEGIFPEVASGRRVLIAAFEESRLVGTVQVAAATPPNQPHRADLAKLLVARRARGKGVAAMLMTEAEKAARETGKTLLVLDTVTGSPAERLYMRMGWNQVGVIPKYALFPDGRFCDTTVFFKAV